MVVTEPGRDRATRPIGLIVPIATAAAWTNQRRHQTGVLGSTAPGERHPDRVTSTALRSVVPMFTAYVVVTVLAAAATIFAATTDFIRPQWLLANMTKAGVPRSWLAPLGGLKAMGALGLLVGLGVPLLGVVAAAGLVLFFVGAILTHIRAHWYSFTYPAAFLLLAVGSLGLRLASF
jgi:DoxX-like family